MGSVRRILTSFGQNRDASIPLTYIVQNNTKTQRKKSTNS